MRVPRWALGAGMAVVLAGGGLITAGVVSAASNGTTGQNPMSAFITDLAGHLGISVTSLQTALQQTETDQVQQMLKNGKITSATAQKMEQQIQSGKGMPFFGLGGPRGFGRGPGGPGGPGVPGVPMANLLQTASQYLGLSVSQIQTDLQNGQSLTAIANGVSGKSSSGLQSALIAAETTQLQQQVTAGKLTASQEQSALSRFEKTLPGILANTGGGPGGPAGPWAFGGPGGPMLNVVQTASQYLGLSVSQIQTDLQNGQSLTAIANGVSGKSSAGLQSALIAAETTQLQQEVTAGKLTSSQEQAALTKFQSALPGILANTGGPGGMGGGRGGWVHWHGAPPMGGGSASASASSSNSSNSASNSSGSSSSNSAV